MSREEENKIDGDVPPDREENDEIGGDVPHDMVNWSNLPPDMVEHIIERLGWLDQIRFCKAWSVSVPHVPTIDNFPWALVRRNSNEYSLIYPPLKEYFARGERARAIFHDARAYASSHGWVLVFGRRSVKMNFFLYSPFTTEGVNWVPSILNVKGGLC
ncbi:F-box protein [Corchorus olitorius]|uniref:F-box protein n=1 Tax=Corchorus olitorius TaxID=93759 RepID=A0A1R3JPP3_9ROSI|nr:F-box protein [Corchorus olitorius]